MNDPRITPDPELVKQRDARQVVSPVVDLYRSPNGPRDRQLIFGEAVMLLNQQKDWCYVQADKDRYCGWVTTPALGSILPATHQIVAPATHVYARPDFKSPDLLTLSFGSQLHISALKGKFAQISTGFVPLTHLSDVSTKATDPAAIAALFLGTPYLWGGNSRCGIDCSGLVQAALLACAIPCPGDSDQQQAIGEPASGPYQRNDLLFWKGHVALVTDADTLIHANAYAMSVTFEPIKTAIHRIKDQGDGPVTAHRRL